MRKEAVTGGELVVSSLQAAGVIDVFGLHGAHIDAVFQACMDVALPIWDTRSEAGAGHAAEGYARASNRLGVAVVTAGGGLTNVITPLANAMLDRTPLLVIAGSGTVADDETNTLQAGLDQVAIVAPVTKWAKRVLAAEHIPRLIAQAIRVATTAPRGPVVLDIPWDILTRSVNKADVQEIVAPHVSGGAPSRQDIDAVIDRLAKARRPVLIVGSEATRGGASESIAKFASLTSIPVFADFEGLAATFDVPEVLHGGLIQGLSAFAKSHVGPDLVVLAGVRFGLHTAHGDPLLLPSGADIIQIDPAPAEIARLRAVSLGLCTDVATTLAALAEEVARHGFAAEPDWPARVRHEISGRRKSVAGAVRKTSPGVLHPFTASEILARHIERDNTLVLDGALTYLWFSELASFVRPRGFLCHGYLGSMGVGMGTAAGSQVAMLRTGRRTFLVTGDGAVGFGIAEFDTFVRHRLPVIVVVMNNHSWGATQHFQKHAVGASRITNTMLGDARYDRVAEAFGAKGFYADDERSFEEALGAAIAHDGPCCIEVQVALDPLPPEELQLIGIDPFATP